LEGFAELFDALDRSSGTSRKIDLLATYLSEVQPADGSWALALLLGERRRRLITGRKLRAILQASVAIPDWLFEDCHSHVGDSAETVCLLWPQLRNEVKTPPDISDSRIRHLIESIIESQPLHWWMDILLPALASSEEDVQHKAMVSVWLALPERRHFLFNKLLTGGFRIGVARGLVVKAVAKAFSLEETLILERLMGGVETEPEWFARLTSPAAEKRKDRGAIPYPFFLASPVQAEKLMDQPPEQWWVEWKWDGIRGQLIRRRNGLYLWSRGEELINESFPELIEMAEEIPVDTVLDGEVICWKHNEQRPLPFSSLQRRLGRKRVGASLRSDCPVQFVAYDVLEHKGEDLRSYQLHQRLKHLEVICKTFKGDQSWRMKRSGGEYLTSWEQLEPLRQKAGEGGAEGLMLKQRESPYLAGRKRGYWWKHKLEPMTLDAVLIYAQAGSGRRANLFTDYTFALWNRSAANPEEHQLVTFAKAYSGLKDTEILELDRWIRRHTSERYGPTRKVKPELVFEIGFEGIQLSKRHKCGLAVRFPRILRWRHDRDSESADSLASARELLRPQDREVQ
tara:strand:+ start:1398 stop:3104 length:1707 start_codon:yes stop_codon:yes gene_type:complete